MDEEHEKKVVKKGRRWHSVCEEEPFSGTNADAVSIPEPLSFWDVIEHPDRHTKGGK